jgi:hypothetical protein
MREPSLRPERSASANSATSAFLCGLNFISKIGFVNLDENLSSLYSLAKLQCLTDELREQNSNDTVM